MSAPRQAVAEPSCKSAGPDPGFGRGERQAVERPARPDHQRPDRNAIAPEMVDHRAIGGDERIDPRDLAVGEEAFRRELSRARTFAQAHEIEGLRAAGLARGGSLDNAVVVDGARVLNPAGLRVPDEFVRHKLLDAVGDLALAGVALHARFVGHRSGHALNNRLLRALFADPANWRPAEAPAWAAGAAIRPIEVARAA